MLIILAVAVAAGNICQGLEEVMCALLTLQILPNGAILSGEEVPLAHTRCTGSKEYGALFEVPCRSEGKVSHCSVTNRLFAIDVTSLSMP